MDKEILVGKKLLRHEDIERITSNIAAELDQRFSNSDTFPVMIGILKGGAPFMFDIVRKMKTIVDLEFMSVSSYAGTKSTGKINVRMGLTQDVTGKDVIIVDDVIETGLTTYFLMKYLKEEKHVRSITNIFLVNKTKNRKYDVPVDFSGLTYDGDRFLIGYGLDYHELLRNIFGVYELTDEDIKKIDEIYTQDHQIAKAHYESGK